MLSSGSYNFQEKSIPHGLYSSFSLNNCPSESIPWIFLLHKNYINTKSKIDFTLCITQLVSWWHDNWMYEVHKYLVQNVLIKSEGPCFQTFFLINPWKQWHIHMFSAYNIMACVGFWCGVERWRHVNGVSRQWTSPQYFNYIFFISVPHTWQDVVVLGMESKYLNTITNNLYQVTYKWFQMLMYLNKNT